MPLQLETGQVVHRATIEQARQWVGHRQPLQLAGTLLQQQVRLLPLPRSLGHTSLQFSVEPPQLVEVAFAFTFEEELVGGVAENLEEVLGAPGLEKVVVDVASVDRLDGVLQL